MEPSAIKTLRLFNQQLISPQFNDVKSLVKYLGAIQAQDYNMAKWALGLRLPGSTDIAIEYAINAAEIIRTHILRPTWHFVAADDVRWMMELTAAHIKTAMKSSNRQLGLDEDIFKRSNEIIRKALTGQNYLTRIELCEIMNKSGINTSDLRSSHLMFRAELDLIVCNGPIRNKQSTYALMDDRVPETKKLSREEALAKLATRYFKSHGPATLADFSWWSGLSLTSAKSALNLIQSDVLNEVIDGSIYWFFDTGIAPADVKSLDLLPAYDEFLISYKNRGASLQPGYAKDVMTNNGIFKPVILFNGEVVGIWKRLIKKDSVVVEPLFFKPVTPLQKKELLLNLKLYSSFLDKKLIVIGEF